MSLSRSNIARFPCAGQRSTLNPYFRTEENSSSKCPTTPRLEYETSASSALGATFRGTSVFLRRKSLRCLLNRIWYLIVVAVPSTRATYANSRRAGLTRSAALWKSNVPEVIVQALISERICCFFAPSFASSEAKLRFLHQTSRPYLRMCLVTEVIAFVAGAFLLLASFGAKAATIDFNLNRAARISGRPLGGVTRTLLLPNQASHIL